MHVGDNLALARATPDAIARAATVQLPLGAEIAGREALSALQGSLMGPETSVSLASLGPEIVVLEPVKYDWQLIPNEAAKSACGESSAAPVADGGDGTSKQGG